MQDMQSQTYLVSFADGSVNRSKGVSMGVGQVCQVATVSAKCALMAYRNRQREACLEGTARHELLDNEETAGHAFWGLGLHAPHPLELHYVPA